MSRIIKFRGNCGGVWREMTPDDDLWEWFWVAVDRETVGQFTGLKDKHGKEVYEGDIIDSTVDPNWIRRWEVYWREDMPEFYVRNINEPDWIDLLGSGDRGDKGNVGVYRIIGNIYENPEMIKQ